MGSAEHIIDDTGESEGQAGGYGWIDPNDVSLLSAEEEVTLGRLVQAGLAAERKLQDLAAAELDPQAEYRRELQETQDIGHRAGNRIVSANIGLVKKAAGKFYATGIDGADLVQAAIAPSDTRNTGLIHAVKKFDPDSGHKFSTYAMWWIMNALQTESNANRTGMPLTQSDSREVMRLHRAEERLAKRYAGEPDDEDLAAELELDVQEVRRLRDVKRHTWNRGAVASLDMPIGEYEGDTRLSDLIPDVSTAESEQMRVEQLALEKLIGRLSARQQVVIRMINGYHDPDGKPANLRHIAQRIGYGVPAARQDLIRARVALRAMVGVSSDDSDEPSPQAEQGVRPVHEGMAFADLLTDPRFSIAVQRMLAVSTTPVKQVLGRVYGIGPHTFPGQPLNWPEHQGAGDMRPAARLQKADETLRAIIDDKLDFAKLPMEPGAPHFIIFMARAGMPLPEDADLATLRQSCIDWLEASPHIVERTRHFIEQAYGLRTGTPQLLEKVGVEHGVSMATVHTSISRAVRVLATAAANAGEHEHTGIVEKLAANIPHEVWLTDGRLRLVAERALELLTHKQLTVMAGRSGFYGPKPSIREIMAELDINKGTYDSIRHKSVQRLRRDLPLVAAGTLDYLKRPSNTNHQGVVEFMVRSGMPVPAGMGLEDLKRLGYANLQSFRRSDVISRHDEALFVRYYGLDTPDRPADATEIADQLGYSLATLRQNILRYHRTMLMAAPDRGQSDTTRRPLISPGVLRAVLRDYDLPQYT